MKTITSNLYNYDELMQKDSKERSCILVHNQDGYPLGFAHFWNNKMIWKDIVPSEVLHQDTRLYSIMFEYNIV